MNYASIKWLSIENGPGVRISLFVTGCPICCPECHNPDLQNPECGEPFQVAEMKLICEELKGKRYSGISILGGEPLASYNLSSVRDLISTIRRTVSTSVWLYTGYTYESLTTEQKLVAKMCDVIVDGPYKKDLRDPSLSFRGSSNQRIIDMYKTNLVGEVVLYEL